MNTEDQVMLRVSNVAMSEDLYERLAVVVLPYLMAEKGITLDKSTRRKLGSIVKYLNEHTELAEEELDISEMEVFFRILIDQVAQIVLSRN